MKALNKDWEEFSLAFKYFKQTILPEIKKAPFYPEPIRIFRAFNECELSKLKVIILGQDPYFDGSATGLCFENYIQQKKMSPSLRNILTEIKNDVGESSWDGQEGALSHLPEQGVLLINTALTVEHNNAGSHTKLWKPFTETIIKDLQTKDNLVWILWGNHAKSFKPLVTNNTHLILEGTHPMPLAANRGGFFGGKYFTKTNEFLKSKNLKEIQW